VYQQQQPLAAAEDDRGRPSKLGHDGRLPGWKQPALLSLWLSDTRQGCTWGNGHWPRSGRLLFLETPDLSPQLPGKYDSGTMDRQRGRRERLCRPGIASVEPGVSWCCGEK